MGSVVSLPYDGENCNTYFAMASKISKSLGFLWASDSRTEVPPLTTAGPCTPSGISDKERGPIAGPPS
jgi:hypothetical protein